MYNLHLKINRFFMSSRSLKPQVAGTRKPHFYGSLDLENTWHILTVTLAGRTNIQWHASGSMCGRRTCARRAMASPPRWSASASTCENQGGRADQPSTDLGPGGTIETDELPGAAFDLRPKQGWRWAPRQPTFGLRESTVRAKGAILQRLPQPAPAPGTNGTRGQAGKAGDKVQWARTAR